MRFVLYNIRYATGVKAHGFVRSSRRNLERIGAFLQDLEPDLVGLVEVDYGSYRMGRENQAELLAQTLGHYHSYATKYGRHSVWRHVPVLNRQGNAFLARDRIRNETFHFFERGMKRLVIELELEHLDVYLVHLSLGGRARHQQLSSLYSLVKKNEKPCIVAGDFNLLWGENEIDLFLAATGLNNANSSGLPTYPSGNPSRHLDFVLYSSGINVRDFKIPPVELSDHLPLVVDFDVQVAEDHREKHREVHCSCRKYTELNLSELSR
ncbi:MAG: endonuclease/exonuclease/phosphatase family protein [Desulfuromonadales bacterium]|nr:endonuclease/exonuclease/phosphatase family protein [Desulfuromonadales bacterium]MBN2792462.1 endonuclease/exonuclease/phosphatase family protein [Desulfuromonadales bacterium]